MVTASSISAYLEIREGEGDKVKVEHVDRILTEVHPEII